MHNGITITLVDPIPTYVDPIPTKPQFPSTNFSIPVKKMQYFQPLCRIREDTI